MNHNHNQISDMALGMAFKEALSRHGQDFVQNDELADWIIQRAFVIDKEISSHNDVTGAFMYPDGQWARVNVLVGHTTRINVNPTDINSASTTRHLTPTGIRHVRDLGMALVEVRRKIQIQTVKL